MRVLAFFPFASAYLALLPLLARHQISGGPQTYGLLLGAIGIRAVGGSLALRWLKDELGPDRLVAAGSLGTAFALILFGLPESAGRCPGPSRSISSKALKAFADLADAGQAKDLPHADWLALLLDRETSWRRDKRLLRAAKLRQQASVEDIDYRAARGLDRALFQKLSEGDWIDAHDNLALVGPSGSGRGGGKQKQTRRQSRQSGCGAAVRKPGGAGGFRHSIQRVRATWRQRLAIQGGAG